MKTVILVVLTLVLLSDGKNTTDDDLGTEIAKAKHRIQIDYLMKLWQGANEAISESQDKILKIYTEYTIKQAQNVIDHISIHQNRTVTECAGKRATVAGAKNLQKLVTTMDCVFANEAETLKAYKLTGYNLHNCIRMAQTETETKYLDIVKNLKNIKDASLRAYDHYVKTLDNCVESTCVLSNLFRSIIEYEKLTEEVSTNVTEVNNISTRYVFTHIAMGCVSASIAQISENYEIGKALVDKCLTPGNESRAIDPPETTKREGEFS